MTRATVGLLLAVMWSASPCGAQVTLAIGGGAAVPVGALADVARTGPQGSAGVLLGVAPPGLGVGLEAVYGRNRHRVAGGRSSVYGAFAMVSYARTISELGPVDAALTAGLGGLRHARSSADFPGLDGWEAGLAARAGVKVSVLLARYRPFVGARYTRGLGGLNTSAFPTELVALELGVSMVIPG